MPSASSSLSVFHGDTLRCIILYIPSHESLSPLRQVNHQLHEEASKPTLWPQHLLALQISTPSALEKIALSGAQIASRVQELDLTKFQPRLILSLHHLLCFTRLNVLKIGLTSSAGVPVSSAGGGAINAAALARKKTYQDILVQFLSSPQCNSTIHTVHLAVDQEAYDYTPLLSHIPSLTRLQIDMHPRSTATMFQTPQQQQNFSSVLEGLTDQSCPHLRELIIDHGSSQTRIGHVSPTMWGPNPADHPMTHFQTSLTKQFSGATKPPLIKQKACLFSTFCRGEWSDSASETLATVDDWSKFVEITSITIDLNTSGHRMPNEEQVKTFLKGLDRLYELQQEKGEVQPPQLHIRLLNVISSWKKVIEEVKNENAASSSSSAAATASSSSSSSSSPSSSQHFVAFEKLTDTQLTSLHPLLSRASTLTLECTTDYPSSSRDILTSCPSSCFSRLKEVKIVPTHILVRDMMNENQFDLLNQSGVILAEKLKRRWWEEMKRKEEMEEKEKEQEMTPSLTGSPRNRTRTIQSNAPSSSSRRINLVYEMQEVPPPAPSRGGLLGAILAGRALRRV